MKKLNRIFAPVLLAVMVQVVSLWGNFVGFNATALAACATPNNTKLTFNLPNYPFWQIVAAEMAQCGNLETTFGFDAGSVTPDPLKPDENLGSLVGISNASLYRLSSQGLLRPLDDLVERYRAKLADRQLIRVDGKVMAIGVAANTKALMVHGDLLKQEEVTIPTDYAGFIAAADKLKGLTLYNNSFSLAYKIGWNLTQEFIDQFLGVEARLLDENNKPLVNGPIGIATLERMKKLATYLPENHLEADSARVLDDLLAFRAPMSITWASNAGALDNPAVSRVAGKMLVLPAPSVVAGGKPASTLWWDGFAIPSSVSNEEAEAAFTTALEGLDSEMLVTHRDDALWLLKDYEPGKLAKELMAAIDKGIPIYPDSSATDVLHRSLGPQIGAYMRGEKTAEAALADAEADYLRAARERGVPGF
jgi:ABC-type glycerol-3-phosphate transport system substrate-binding protein